MTLPKILSQLDGYDENSEQAKGKIPNVIFNNNMDIVLPSYFVSKVEIDGSICFAGIYEGYMNAPGRLSIFYKSKGVWARSDKFDGNSHVYTYSFPEASRMGYFLTFDAYIYADSSGVDVESWQLRKGKLVRQPYHFEDLTDSDLEIKESSLMIPYTKSLRHTYEDMAGTRSLNRVIYKMNNRGAIEAADYHLTPWLDVIDEYFGYLNNNNSQKATGLVSDKSILGILSNGCCDRIKGHGGSVDKGFGYVDISSMNNEDIFYHIELQKVNDYFWRISQATLLKNRNSTK